MYAEKWWPEYSSFRWPQWIVYDAMVFTTAVPEIWESRAFSYVVLPVGAGS